MDIFTSVLTGAVIGGLAIYVVQVRGTGALSTVVVGILGALLGLATDKWLGSGGLNDLTNCVFIASVAGSILLLFLWAVAQRLFLAPITTVLHE